MTGLEIWLLAIGLAMDCFAVSIASGIILKRVQLRPMLITNALAIVWLLNKQVGVLSLISELLNCSAEIWTIQDDTTCDCYL